MSTNRVARRLRAELRHFRDFQRNGYCADVKIVPSFENQCLFTVYLQGPEASPYEGGVFVVLFYFEDRYPFVPPTTRFQTKIWHPTISTDGIISIDLTNKYNWSPATIIADIIPKIADMLADPQDLISLNNAAFTQLFTNNDRNAFEEQAREWTIRYAK